MADFQEMPYSGGELDLFACATNWKRYLREQILPYLAGDVLEVGAGIGGTTQALHEGIAGRWTCLEPDAHLAQRLKANLRLSSNTKTNVVIGSLRAFAETPSFDCVLYIDVLEHIDDDRSQIDAAARLVRPDGRIVILSPAHQCLFSEFDKRIGHRRRYNRASLRCLMPCGWREEKLMYMDAVGAILSLGNAFLLGRSVPTESQILFWDRVCVPSSRIIDRLVQGMLGKSLLAVWHKVPQ